MKHARPDYDRIQDPALQSPDLLGNGCTPFGEDEPVFLIRARDKHFIPAMAAYLALLVSEERYDPPMVQTIAEHIERARKWQLENGTKTPDMPKRARE